MRKLTKIVLKIPRTKKIMTLITATLSTVIILTNVSTIQAEENNSEPYVEPTTSVIFFPEESIEGVSIENQEVVITTEAAEETSLIESGFSDSTTVEIEEISMVENINTTITNEATTVTKEAIEHTFLENQVLTEANQSTKLNIEKNELVEEVLPEPISDSNAKLLTDATEEKVKQGYHPDDNKYYIDGVAIINRWATDATGNQYYANATGLVDKKIIQDQFFENDVLQKDRHINVAGNSYYFDTLGKRVKSATVHSDKLSSWFIADDNGVLTYEVTPWGHYVNNMRQFDTLAKVKDFEFYFEPKQWGGGLAWSKWSYSPTQSSWYKSNPNGIVEQKVTPNIYTVNGITQKDKHVSINGVVSYYYEPNGDLAKNKTSHSTSMGAYFVSDAQGKLIYEVTPWGFYVNSKRQYDALAKVANKEFYFEPQQWGGGLARNKWAYSPTHLSWFRSNQRGEIEHKVMPSGYTINGITQKDKHVSINGTVSYYYDLSGILAKNKTSYSTRMGAYFVSDAQGKLIYEVTPWGLYINARRQYDTLAKVAGKEFYFEPQQWGGGLARNKWSYSPTVSTWYYSDINGFLTKSANQTSYKENGTQRFDIIVDINGYKLYYETVQYTGILARNKWSYSPNAKSWYYSDLEGIIQRITKSNPNPLSASELSKYNNRRLDFWFRASAPYSGRRNGIGSYEQSLMDKYDGVWIGPDKKEIYLTMDLGYEYLNNTTRILDIAREKNIKITFFVTDMFLRTHPDVVKRLADEGHLVGNHTMNHPYLNEAIANSVSGYEYELRELENKYRQVTGQELAKFMRPPYGAYSERVLAANQMLGYKTVFWSYGYRDWDTTNQPVRSTALNQLIGQLHNGEVLLLHSVSTTNVSLLGEFIDITRSKGFTFKTVNQMP